MMLLLLKFRRKQNENKIYVGRYYTHANRPVLKGRGDSKDSEVVDIRDTYTMATYSVNFTNVKQENAFSSFETTTQI